MPHLSSCTSYYNLLNACSVFYFSLCYKKHLKKWNRNLKSLGFASVKIRGNMLSGDKCAEDEMASLSFNTLLILEWERRKGWKRETQQCILKKGKLWCGQSRYQERGHDGVDPPFNKNEADAVLVKVWGELDAYLYGFRVPASPDWFSSCQKQLSDFITLNLPYLQLKT